MSGQVYTPGPLFRLSLHIYIYYVTDILSIHKTGDNWSQFTSGWSLPGFVTMQKGRIGVNITMYYN